MQLTGAINTQHQSRLQIPVYVGGTEAQNTAPPHVRLVTLFAHDIADQVLTEALAGRQGTHTPSNTSRLRHTRADRGRSAGVCAIARGLYGHVPHFTRASDDDVQAVARLALAENERVGCTAHQVYAVDERTFHIRGGSALTGAGQSTWHKGMANKGSEGRDQRPQQHLRTPAHIAPGEITLGRRARREPLPYEVTILLGSSVRLLPQCLESTCADLRKCAIRRHGFREGIGGK